MLAPTRLDVPPSNGLFGLFWGHFWQLLLKDLRLEWRSREIIYTVALFSALLVLIFAFAFAQVAEPVELAGGALWVTLAFSGTVGLGRYFDREREGETIQALLVSPMSRPALYLAKLCGTALFMLLSEAVVLPLLIVLFEIRLSSAGLFLALLLLGTIGYAAVGSLFAAGLLRARSRGVLLGLLTYPIVVPVLIAGTKGTAALAGDMPEPAAAILWLKLLGVYDVVFIVLSLWSFGSLVGDE